MRSPLSPLLSIGFITAAKWRELYDDDRLAVLDDEVGSSGRLAGKEVHAQRDRRLFTDLAGDVAEPFQLRGGFDVEAENVRCQCLAHFVGGLADAGEDHPGRIAASSNNAALMRISTSAIPTVETRS